MKIAKPDRAWWRERQDFRACPHAPGPFMNAFALVSLPFPFRSPMLRRAQGGANGQGSNPWAPVPLSAVIESGPKRSSGVTSIGGAHQGMNLNLIVDIVILLVIIAIGVAVLRAWRSRPARARLTPLPPETRNLYVSDWDRIEKRFIDAPDEAVMEADSMITALLGERGHPLRMDRLPRRLRSAKIKLQDGQRRHRTEDLRRALLDYRAVYVRMIGPEQPEWMAEGRRETA
jgi:hypothetical protein